MKTKIMLKKKTLREQLLAIVPCKKVFVEEHPDGLMLIFNRVLSEKEKERIKDKLSDVFNVVFKDVQDLLR